MDLFLILPEDIQKIVESYIFAPIKLMQRRINLFNEIKNKIEWIESNNYFELELDNGWKTFKYEYIENNIHYLFKKTIFEDNFTEYYFNKQNSNYYNKIYQKYKRKTKFLKLIKKIYIWNSAFLYFKNECGKKDLSSKKYMFDKKYIIEFHKI